MVKRGLGKGLGALILSEELDNNDENIVKLNIESIKPNSDQPRRNFSKEKLEELAQSIKLHGLIQPIIVRKLEEDQYELIAGERRLRACKMLNHADIPAIIKDYEQRQLAEIALIENLQREDLNPIDEAWAYHKLLSEHNLSQEKIAERIGKSRPYIANQLRLLGLPDRLKDMVAEGKLSTGHAKALLSLDNDEKQQEIADEVLKRQLNVRDTEKMIRAVQLPRNQKPGSAKHRQLGREVRQITEIMIKQLGTKVIISNSGKGGKIEIYFYDQQDLERISDMIIKPDDVPRGTS